MGGNTAPLPRRHGRGPLAFRPFVTIGWLAVLAATFSAGYLLAGYDSDQALMRIQRLQNERDHLVDALAVERNAHLRLERLHSIDLEAKRVVQAQLADVQAERLRFAKQVIYLQRLMQDGGAGIVEVKEFVLTDAAEAGEFDYRMIVNQLVPEFGRSKGTAIVKLAVRQGDETEILALSDLPGSTSGRHPFSFEHFQSFNGTIRIPPRVKPRYAVVDILPQSDNLVGSSESFTWHADNTRELVFTPTAPNE